MAPCFLGPAQGIASLPELSELSSRVKLQFHEIRSVGDDLRLLARVVQSA
jgi:diaminohydroxyphosphoribosylaminopyrimidine deaminase/5-amino-6-(5-phosphoribosylamino)uracil reductase